MNLLILRYLDVLRAELKHIERTVDEMVHDHDRGGLAGPEHTTSANASPLVNEESGIRNCLDVLDSIRADAYTDLDVLVQDLNRRFSDVIRKTGLAEIAVVFAQQKLLKVRRYVTES
jgi:hypothetical protein